jgi:CheY-like chemotaxis protein
MEQEKLRILLVEDSPADTRLLEEELSDAGVTAFHVTYAGRLAHAVRAWDPGAFDVVLLDLSLPDSKGLETVRRAMAGLPGVPIVVLTTLKDDVTAAQAVAAGAQDYLVKGDADGHAMIRAIRHAMARHRVMGVHSRGGDPRESREAGTCAIPRTAFGSATLPDLFPDAFDELSKGYGRILGHAMAPLTGGEPLDPAAALPALAERLGVLRASPADVLALHARALGTRSLGATAHVIVRRAEKSDPILLQLMGHLAAFYLRHSASRPS